MWSAVITIPPYTIAEFHVPTIKAEAISLSSGKPKVLHKTDGRVVIELAPGKHTLSLVAQ